MNWRDRIQAKEAAKLGKQDSLPEGTGKVHIRAENLRSDDGVFRVGLFTGPRGFPEDFSQALQVATLPIHGRTTSHTFPDVPFGYIALCFYHDVNENQVLDKNFIGQPVEDYGFSNDIRGLFSAPSFRDCAVRFVEPELTLRWVVRRVKVFGGGRSR